MSGKYARYKIAPASLRTLGLALTVIWLGVVLYFVMWRSAERFELWDLTNLVVVGFTPPVLLWLIRAVLRQSRTLRMIEGQLHLQIQELQRMVVQQKRMVEDLRSQKRKMVADLEAQRAKELQASRPLLQMKIIGIGGTVDDRNLVHFVLLNHGRTCTDVLLSFNGGHASQEFLRLSDGGELPFKLALPTAMTEPVRVKVSYLDQQLRRGTERFLITGEDSSFQVTPVVEANPN
jgi:hypothetical protein